MHEENNIKYYFIAVFALAEDANPVWGYLILESTFCV